MAAIKRRSAGTAKFTPKKAKNAVAVAKVIGPALVPVIMPFAAKAAAVLREYKDNRRAHRLGVPVDDLAKFTGKGGALHARIAGLADALATLQGDKPFVDETQATLTQLTAAVRAAERMPAPRRKAAHRAVATELEQLEQRLLHKLGL
jgi:hypothetical protein